MMTNNYLLVPPVVEPASDAGFRFSPSRDYANFKRCLLYFPRIAIIPFYNKAIPINLVNPDYQVLALQGQIKAVGPFSFRVPKLDHDFFKEAEKFAWRYCNVNSDDQFSINSDFVVESDNPNALVVSLIDALPDVNPECSITDLLQFKLENSLQLIELGVAINRIVNTVAFGQLSIHNVDVIRSEIAGRADEVMAAGKRAGVLGGRITLEVGSFINNAVIPVLMELLAESINLPSGVGAFVGAGIQVKLGRNPVGSYGNQFPKEFQYLFNASRSHLLGGLSEFSDDYMYHRVNDRMNSFTFTMPIDNSEVVVSSNKNRSIENCYF